MQKDTREGDVLCTEELARRPARAFDPEAELHNLCALGESLAEDPAGALEHVVELALSSCAAGSAGVSFLDATDDGATLHWPAIAGAWSGYTGGRIPREASPCGEVMSRGSLQLFRDVQRRYTLPAEATAPLIEALVAPVVQSGRTIGTLWVLHHAPESRFDAGDAQRLTRLAPFAAAAWRQRQLAATQTDAPSFGQRATPTSALGFSPWSHEEALTLAHQMRLITDSLPALIAYVDREERFRFNNRAYEEFFGKTRQESFGRHVAEVLGREAYEQIRDRLRAALDGRRMRFEAVVAHRDGSHRTVWAEYVPDIRTDGSVAGLYALVTDVTRQKAVEAELRLADRRKDAFLATLAHELRNPLASIRAAITLLQGGPARDEPAERRAAEPGTPDGDRGKRSLAVIDRQSLHLVRLIDDLLDVSRITRGVINVRRQVVDLVQVAKEVVDSLESEAKVRGIQLRLEAEQHARLAIDADPVRIAQIVGNLLNNALCHTSAGGRVFVRLAREGDSVRLEVSDTGAGIAPEELPRLFQMFSQGGASSGARTEHKGGREGLGIGLWLSRELARLHGGTLEGESPGAGRGATFVLRLPAGALARHTEEAPSPLVSLPRTATARRVLVVEDNADLRELLTTYLSEAGFDVRGEGDGASALEAVGDFDPEVVILDVGLPDVDGYAVARALRAMNRKRALELIAMTGWGQESDRRRAMEAGFDHHLTKPADLDALVRLLRSSTHSSSP
jgi:PAS domain S-box-containing protein